MKPVAQTLFGPQEGNCLQACIASLFELSIEEVPHFVLEEDWVMALDNWLAQYDLQSVDVDLGILGQGNDRWEPLGFHLICGISPRYECAHAVVGYNGKMIWDPHPDGDGLAEAQTWTLFVKRFDNL